MTKQIAVYVRVSQKSLDQEQERCENGSDGGGCRCLRRFIEAMEWT